ncbi:MAG: hypothetical protein IAG10_22645 [Planctomycetaceae bacterium]|nr:hypothetical protein [Planctomycetaceae bacterium]
MKGLTNGNRLQTNCNETAAGLRHTFDTMLSMAGVAPRVAQAAMRHSSIDLTMSVYTDPRLLDLQGAIESLPGMTVTSEPNEQRQRIAAGC